MADGMNASFVLYDDQFHGGFSETIMQQTNAFNAAAGGVLSLTTKSRLGDFAKESFLQELATPVVRRDLTDNGAATSIPLSMDEFISVKLNRTNGPFVQTLDSFKKIGKSASDQALSFLIGQQIAKANVQGMLNDCLTGLVAFISGQASNTHLVAANGPISGGALNDGIAKFGDNFGSLVGFVMHSRAYFDLVGNQIDPTNHGDNIAGVVVQGGTPATFGRPVLVTDSPSLLDTGVYQTLALVRGAAMAEDSEETTMVAEMKTGDKQLKVLLQGEHAFNLGIKGAKWDTAAGGVNPTSAALGTSTNWVKVLSDAKSLAGVVIQHEAA